ncbi:acylphosphatase [Baaleninema sp.]|uniref:acylphosphatase n=1 Tax=Baaleninema sp. TaxID=3101197 RepID=UPI003CFF17F8
MTVNESTQTRVRLLISGTVQGVGFRYSTRQQAEQLGLSGWVRNRSDGRVEAVFEGKVTAVEQAVAWCRQGPLSAEVTDLSISSEDPQGLARFEVRPTA